MFGLIGLSICPKYFVFLYCIFIFKFNRLRVFRGLPHLKKYSTILSYFIYLDFFTIFHFFLISLDSNVTYSSVPGKSKSRAQIVMVKKGKENKSRKQKSE